MSNYVWVGGASGNWNVASNWQVGGNPAASPPWPRRQRQRRHGWGDNHDYRLGLAAKRNVEPRGRRRSQWAIHDRGGSLVDYGSSVTIENGASLNDTGVFTADYETALTVSGPSSATSFSAASLQ